MRKKQLTFPREVCACSSKCFEIFSNNCFQASLFASLPSGEGVTKTKSNMWRPIYGLGKLKSQGWVDGVWFGPPAGHYGHIGVARRLAFSWPS